jgi:hypothetical protein
MDRLDLMSPEPAPMSLSEALDAAANDADANAGSGNVGDPETPCPGAPTPVPKSSLWIRLDLTPDEATMETGSLRLQGATGGYDKTISIAGNFDANPDPDNTVDVHFENVPTNANYSLTYIAGDGQVTPVIQDTPFFSLQDSSPPAQNSAPALMPEPNP